MAEAGYSAVVGRLAVSHLAPQLAVARGVYKVSYQLLQQQQQQEQLREPGIYRPIRVLCVSISSAESNVQQIHIAATHHDELFFFFFVGEHRRQLVERHDGQRQLLDDLLRG